MIWQLKSLIVILLGVVFLALGFLVEAHTEGSPLIYLFGVPGGFLTLVGVLHLLLNALVLELIEEVEHAP